MHLNLLSCKCLLALSGFVVCSSLYALDNISSISDEPVKPVALRSEIHRGTFSMIVENDVFAGTDRHYTNGLQLAYFAHPDELGGWVVKLADFLPFLKSLETLRTGYFFGHEIFTPDDTEAITLIPDERPYAAWLYGGMSISSNTERHFDVWRLNLGTVGPSARGERVQNGFHRFIGVDEANGWDNQIEDDAGYMLIYERGWRNRLLKQEAGEILGVDMVPHLGFAFGNVQQYVNGGVTLRLGKDLANDFGPPRIRPALPGSAFFDPRDGVAWYLFSGIGMRYMDRNGFIDDHRSSELFVIEKEPWIWDAQAGFVLTVGRVRLTYTFVYRSEEYDLQDTPDKFASIGLSIKL